MPNYLTRRETLLAGGTLGAGLLLASGPQSAFADERKKSTESALDNQTWDALKISQIASKNLISSIGATEATPKSLKEMGAEGQLFQVKDFRGATTNGYRTTCDPRYINVLKVNGQDLRIADWVSFGYGSIEWKAGEGWPIYRVPDPRHDFNINMKFNCYMHCILIGCLHDNGTLTYTVPYGAPGAYHLGAGRVVAMVNDDLYDDNRGYFDVEVYGWT